MEVFWNAYQDRVIDIALDVAGYVLAGSLWLLVYSSWQARRARRAEAAAPIAVASNETATVPMPSQPTAREGRRSLEFVSFGGTSPRETTPVSVPDSHRGRNRAEVFSVARRMLAEGVSADAVKSELPISDGELALLDAKK